jgi:hypothetical protein
VAFSNEANSKVDLTRLSPIEELFEGHVNNLLIDHDGLNRIDLQSTQIKAWLISDDIKDLSTSGTIYQSMVGAIESSVYEPYR